MGEMLGGLFVWGGALIVPKCGYLDGLEITHGIMSR